MTPASTILWLAVAGALGTLARYGLASAVQRLSSSGFPWGTLAVNGLGCLAFGFVWALAEERLVPNVETRMIVLVGFMGAFTTFSTYAADTGLMLRSAAWVPAAANLLAHNVLGVVLFFTGVALGRAV